MHLKATKWIKPAAALTCIALFSSIASAALPPKLQAVANEGRNIFTHPSFGGNGNSCNSCHHDGGTKEGKLPNGVIAPKLLNAATIFPRIDGQGQLVTLEDQIRDCVGGAIQGTPPAYDSKTMRELMVYLKSLAQGKKINLGGKPG